MKKSFIFLLAGIALAVSCRQASPRDEALSEVDEMVIPECVVSSVPDSLNLDPFYVKYVDVNGLPLVSS